MMRIEWEKFWPLSLDTIFPRQNLEASPPGPLTGYATAPEITVSHLLPHKKASVLSCQLCKFIPIMHLISRPLPPYRMSATPPFTLNNALYSVRQKVSPKVVCHFLSNHLKFLREILRLLLFIYTKVSSGICLPLITIQLQNFVCDHLMICTRSKICVRKILYWNKWATLLSWWRQSDANFVNNKSVRFVHRQFLYVFGKAFIVDATSVC